MRVRAVDMNLFEKREADAVLDAYAFLHRLRVFRFLRDKLIAWEGENLQPVRMELLMELLQLRVPARRLPSFRCDVHYEHCLSA